MLNKPAGVVSTAKEPGRRRAVVELVDSERRLYRSGASTPIRPASSCSPMTASSPTGLPTPAMAWSAPTGSGCATGSGVAKLRRLRGGVELDDGPTSPAKVRRTSPRVIEMTIAEGRNRQVRRMIESGWGTGGGAGPHSIRPAGTWDSPRGQGAKVANPEVRRLWKDAEE